MAVIPFTKRYPKAGKIASIASTIGKGGGKFKILLYREGEGPEAIIPRSRATGRAELERLARNLAEDDPTVTEWKVVPEEAEL